VHRERGQHELLEALDFRVAPRQGRVPFLELGAQETDVLTFVLERVAQCY
jgi:hypothetical protein